MGSIDVLRRGREIVEQGWCQHAFGGDRANGFVASANCLQGALWRAIAQSEASDEVLAECLDLFRGVTGVAPGATLTRWNDEPGRTKEEVLEAFDLAIASARVLDLVPA